MLTSALLDSQSSLLLCYPSFQARSVPSLDAKTLASVLTWPNPASRGRGQVTPQSCTKTSTVPRETCATGCP